MSVGAQMIVVLEAIVEHCVPLVLGHPFEFSRLEIAQTDISHSSLPVSGSGAVWPLHDSVILSVAAFQS
jgi:hypothetical protein